MGRGTLLFCSIALLCGLAVAEKTWYAGIGGSPSGADAIKGACFDGDRRWMFGFHGQPSIPDNWAPDFYFGTMSQGGFSASNFVAKVTGEQSLKWIDDIRVPGSTSPFRCVDDEAGSGEMCDKWDDKWMATNVGTVYHMGVATDYNPVILAGWTGYNSKTFFYAATDYSWDWQLVVDVEPARIRQDGLKQGAIPTTQTVDGTKYGTFQDIPASIKLLHVGSGKKNMYALFAVTGNLRVGKFYSAYNPGKVYDVKQIKYDVFAQLSDNHFDEQYWTTNGVNVGTWTVRDSYILLSFDMTNGELNWAMPIAGQFGGQITTGKPWDLDPTTSDTLFTVSKYDEAVYLSGTITGRVWFSSTPETFGSNWQLSNAAGANLNGAYLVQPTIDTTPITRYIYKSRRIITRITSSGGVNYQVYDPNPTLTTLTYGRYIGTWNTMAASDQSTTLYIAGTFSGPSNRLYVTGADVPGTRDGVNPPDTPTEANYDGQDAFIAAFTSDLPATGATAGLIVFRGLDDAPKVEIMTVGSGSLYALMSFTNATIVDGSGSGSSQPLGGKYVYARGDGVGKSVALVTLSSSLAYSDSHVFHTRGTFTVKGFGANNGRAYITATFDDEIAFEYDETNKAAMSAYPRAGSTDFIFITNANDLPDDEGTEQTLDGHEDTRKGLRIGLGVGIGVGVGLAVIIALILLIVMGRRNGSGSGKVAATPV